jgi:ankyrin repeat protein
LGETYERLLSKIEGSERKDMIQRMFKWIVCAREPIHFEEMREAVAFTLEDLAYDPGKLPTDLNRLVRACGNLVIVDEETQVIQLAHHTVQQYLLQQNGSPFQFTIKGANVMAGEFCVAYLSFSNFESQVTRYAENKNIDMLALGRIASRGPMLHPNHQGQAVVRVWNTIRNSRPLPVEINMTRFVPPQKKTWQPANFGFLSYVVTHWLWHTVSFDVNVTDSDQESGRDWIFKNLVLRKQLLFEFRPWGDFQRDARESSSLSLLGWALMANHRYLIRIVASDIAFPSLMDVWQATCDKYFWGRNADQATLRRSHAPWHLNRLDLDYDSSSTLDSPNLVWLFSRFLWACREGHIDAIKEYKIKNLVNTVTADPLMPDNLDSMMHYLTVVASAAGHLQVVQFLCGKVIAPFDDFLVVSDLTKGNGLTAMEHAAISGHLGVVAYLADQGVRPRPLFFPGLYRHFFNEAINDNNIRTVESLLHLRSLRDIAMSPELVMSEQHLSDMLVKAITDGRTDVVRLLLNYGVNPNSPNEFGATPLIEAIRHSRNSIVSMLLEHDCLVDNTAAGMPLTIAAWLGNFSVARELILHGAAIFEEYFEIESMIDPACLHNEQVNDGKLPDPVKRSIRHLCLSPTPLYMACFHGHLSIVQLLLAYGAAANFPSLASLICLSERDGRFIVDSRSAWLLHHRPHFEPKTLFRPATGWEIELPTPESVAKVILYWDLPITAAISRGHEGIVSILLSSGALLPEEFDNLYHSYPDCVGSLQERLETRLANSLMTGSLPKTKQMRTSTIDMGMPRIPASRVRFVRELQVLDVGSTEVQQEHLNSRISVLKDEIQKSNPPYRDPLQATLVRAAENYEIDIVQALIHAGASLTIADIDNMPSPNPKLLIAAKKGNSILRHAFLDMTIAAAITYVDGKKKLCGRKELCQRRLLLDRVVGKTVTTLSRNFTDIRIYCQILEVGVLSNDTRLIKDLYEILLFPFTELNPLDSALFAVVDYGKLSWVQILCKHGANVNARDYNGSTPLLYAVERGATRLVIDGLLVQGADLKAVDDTGETVLYKAAASNEPQALDSLMQVSYCPDATDLDKALALCVSNGNPDAWANIARIVADEDLLPSYDISRARHLLQILCQHVEGLFELPAVRDEIEVPPQYSPPSGSLWSRGPPSQYIPTIGGNIVNAIFDTPKSQTPFKQSNVLESDRTMRDGQSSNQVSEAHSLRYTEPYIPLVGKENARIRGFGDGRWRNDIF